MHFDYLIKEFNYDGPEITFGKQKNGTIISDYITYSNIDKDRAIRISNSYHPVDYGFELKIYHKLTEENLGESKMVFYMLKEKQDLEQDYIHEISNQLKENYSLVIDGANWID